MSDTANHAATQLPFALVNGEPADQVSLYDRGLNYGDGVFETLRLTPAGPYLLDLHLQRLRDGCRRLRLPLDESALARDLLTLEQWCAERRLGEAVIKLVITRGSGGRGYRPPAAAAPTRIAAVHPLPPAVPAEHGVQVRWCDTALSANPQLAGIKHLNRLEQVLARAEWSDDAIAEGLMCDLDGNVIEGTATNLFIVENGVLITPALERCGISGVMRRHIIETVAPALAVPVRVDTVDRARVANAQEVFVCNSVIGVWPVVQCAPVPGGRAALRWPPGAVTHRIRERIVREISA